MLDFILFKPPYSILTFFPHPFFLDALCLVLVEGLFALVQVFQGSVSRVVHDQLHRVLPRGVRWHFLLKECVIWFKIAIN